MKEISFYGTNNQKTVLALGFFDAVHIGHVRVLSECVSLAASLNATPSAFTFFDNPFAYIKSKSDGLLCNYADRLARFADCGIKNTIVAPCDDSFFKQTAEQFLSVLTDNLSVCGIVCGADYTFGGGAKGNVEILRTLCSQKNVALRIVPEIDLFNGKVSSRDIKKNLEIGDITRANALLGYEYSFSGEVKRGRGVGNKFVFPTVNIPLPKDRVAPKAGVYATRVSFEGKTFLGLTNLGAHPTFDDYTVNTETYILGFSGDLYEKSINISFVKFIRDIIKFDAPEDLRKQIEKDIRFVGGEI